MSYKLLVPILLIATQALAWGPEGHQITTEIARRHLTAEALRGCKNFLGDISFADASIWADEVRSDPKYKFLAQFHFARVPVGKTYEQAPASPGGDVITATRALSNYFKTGDQKALDSVSALQQLTKVEAFQALLHFPGDINQPLHISEPEDFGGNKEKVIFVDPNTSDKKETTLHPTWDGLMLKTRKLSVTEYADKIDHATSAQIALWQNLNFEAWADEEIEMRVQIYTFPDPQPVQKPGEEKVYLISTEYITKNLPIVDQQLLKGGIRLAGILNWVFDPGSSPQTAKK